MNVVPIVLGKVVEGRDSGVHAPLLKHQPTEYRNEYGRGVWAAATQQCRSGLYAFRQNQKVGDGWTGVCDLFERR